MRKAAVARRVAVTVARWATALALVWLGGLLAFGAVLQAAWANHPWPGEQEDPVRGALALGGMVLVLAVPPLAWRWLLPRYRWWGIPVTLLFTLALFWAYGAI